MIARAQCADILIGNFRFGTQGSRVFLSPLYYSFSALGLDRVHSFYIHNQCESDGFPQFDQMIPVPMKPIQTSLWQTYLAFNGHNKTIHNHVIYLLINVAFNYKCWKKWHLNILCMSSAHDFIWGGIYIFERQTRKHIGRHSHRHASKGGGMTWLAKVSM